jgi:F-type H+-transporting ATPase subunit delta
MSIETVARRYASALADVVLKTGETETVRTELKAWEQMIAGNADLANAFGNPSIAAAKKEAVLEGLLAKARSSKTTSNFLRVLLQNGRLNDLPTINERFEAVLEERGGTISGEVISAHDLDEAAKQELTANLQKLTGKNVKLNFEIDKNIIGGVVTRVGSTVYDSSVRTQLENLREQLVNG